MAENFGRREFLTIGAAIAGNLFAADERSGDMIYRKLGKTGERVSAIGVGGYHIGMAPDEAAAGKILRTALHRGINFMDNFWGYMGGKSGKGMGTALRDGYRPKGFLVTKI